jgi:hypothetical protein
LRKRLLLVGAEVPRDQALYLNPAALKVHTVEESLTGGPEQPQATKPFQVPTTLVAVDIFVSPFSIEIFDDSRRVARTASRWSLYSFEPILIVRAGATALQC